MGGNNPFLVSLELNRSSRLIKLELWWIGTNECSDQGHSVCTDKYYGTLRQDDIIAECCLINHLLESHHFQKL